MTGPVRRPHRIVRGAALAVCLAVAAIILGAPAASAHAFLVESTPADGVTVQQAPADIRLRFSESVALDAMTVEIVDSHGREHRPIAVRLAESAEPAGESAESAEAAEDTEEPMEVVVELPPLARDAYRVSWRTLSSDDLHRTSGVLVFGIGQAVAAAGGTESLPDIPEVLLRLAIFVALALALGGFLAARLLGRSGSTGALIDRCHTWAAFAAFAGITACTALLTYQMRGSGASAGALLFSAFGGSTVLRIAGFAVLGVVALGARRATSGRRTADGSRPETGRAGQAGQTAGAAAIGIGTALTGHSGASATSLTLVLADAAHVLAGAIFAGTLVLTVVTVLPHAAAGAGIAPMLRAFGRPAGICVAVLVVSGLYLSSGVVASVDAVLLTFYGRILLFKIVVVAVVAACGLVNHRWLRRGDSATFPTRTVRAEASLLALVLLLAAVLTSAQPARAPQFGQYAGGAGTGPARDVVTADIQQVITIQPNTPGRNVVTIDATNVRRPAPAPIRSVTLQLSGPTGYGSPAISTRRLGDGQWSAGADIPWTGPFTMRVTVQRAGMADVTTTMGWTLSSPSGPPRPTVVSNTPIGGTLQVAAATLAFLLGALGALIFLRRRAHTAGLPEPAASRVTAADGSSTPVIETVTAQPEPVVPDEDQSPSAAVGSRQ